MTDGPMVRPPSPTTAERSGGATAVAIGVVACAACCAGPILGWLAALGLGTAGGVALVGGGGLAVAAVGALLILRRRRRAATCTAAPEAVRVTAPTVKASH